MTRGFPFVIVCRLVDSLEEVIWDYNKNNGIVLFVIVCLMKMFFVWELLNSKE